MRVCVFRHTKLYGGARVGPGGKVSFSRGLLFAARRILALGDCSQGRGYIRSFPQVGMEAKKDRIKAAQDRNQTPAGSMQHLSRSQIQRYIEPLSFLFAKAISERLILLFTRRYCSAASDVMGIDFFPYIPPGGGECRD